MKKQKLSLVALGLSALYLFSACETNKKDDPTPNTPGSNNQTCLVSGVSETTASGKEDSEFTYDNQGKLTRINTKENGTLTEYNTIDYSSAGKPTKISTFDAANTLQDYFTVELTNAGNPAKLNFFSRNEDNNQMENLTRYTYNAQNKITKIDLFMDAEGEGTLTKGATIMYAYDAKGNPIHKEYLMAMEEGEEPILAFTYDYTYDDKENPGKNIPVLNIEPSPVNNVKTVVAKNKQTNAVDKQQSYEMTYEYGSNGFPSKSTTTTQAGVTTSQTYAYSCK